MFVRRHTYSANHYYTEFINSRWTPGGNLCVLDLRDGSVHELVPELTGGVFERFDLSFDATRLVFAWKAGPQQGYRLYEVEIDPDTGRRREGTAVRQVTFPPENEEEIVRSYRVTSLYHHGTDDMQPCYLPDGGIAFISTRCQYGILCDAPDNFTTTVLHRVDADGGNLRKLSNSSVSEASPAMLPDGRVMYTRWEYLDKGAVSVKCLWAMRPDGSGSAEIYGNDISLPPTFIYGRPLPGSASGYVVLGTPHCPQNGVGTVIRLDMTRDMRTRQPMTYITPDVDIRAEVGFFHRRNGRWVRDNNGPLFADPFPLSHKFFLVSCNPDRPWNAVDAYGIYLIDEFGNRTLVYRDEAISCWQPVPLMARPAPPQLSEVAAVAESTTLPTAESGQASLVMSDVYRGMEGIPRGTIKHLRIMEDLPRPWSARRFWDGDAFQQQHAAVGMNGHLGVRVVHGVVPVYKDGSANFVVPANKNIYLQALDEDFMEVQRMRTFINLMPGERRSCIGCHEYKGQAPPNQQLLALTRPPSKPAAQVGDTAPRPVHYPTYVQPVLDRHCVACHAGDKIEGDLDLSGELTTLFNRSYENIIRRNLVQKIDELVPKNVSAGRLSFVTDLSPAVMAADVVYIAVGTPPGPDGAADLSAVVAVVACGAVGGNACVTCICAEDRLFELAVNP